MKVILWLNVVPNTAHDQLWSPGTLWVREVETGFVPDVDDSVTLWPDEAGDNDTTWNVKRRYMGWDGMWHVELCKMLLDPSDKVMKELQRDRTATRESIAAVWWTENGGDPAPDLERGGWRRYGAGD